MRKLYAHPPPPRTHAQTPPFTPPHPTPHIIIGAAPARDAAGRAQRQDGRARQKLVQPVRGREGRGRAAGGARGASSSFRGLARRACAARPPLLRALTQPPPPQPTHNNNHPPNKKHTAASSAPGTIIRATRDLGDSLVTSLVLKNDVTLFDIASTRMLGQFGFLAQVRGVDN